MQGHTQDLNFWRAINALGEVIDAFWGAIYALGRLYKSGL